MRRISQFLLLAVITLAFATGAFGAGVPYVDMSANSLNQGHSTFFGAQRLVPVDLAGESGVGFTISGASLFGIPGGHMVFNVDPSDIAADTDDCPIGPAKTGASVFVVMGESNPANETFHGAVFGIRNVSGTTATVVSGVTSLTTGVPLTSPTYTVNSKSGVSILGGEDYADIDWYQIDLKTGTSIWLVNKVHND